MEVAEGGRVSTLKKIIPFKNNRSKTHFAYLSKMRFLITLLFIFGLSFSAFSQSEKIAQNYFDQGEFEKAKSVYEKLYQKSNGSLNFLQGLVKSLQELEQYEEAEKYLIDFSKRNTIYPNLLVEIGYNYQLQDQQEKAEEYYQQAIDKIDKIPNYAYTVGRAFQNTTQS